MYFLLEYFKTVAFGWMFLEGFYLHNQLVITVFNSEPRLTPYLIAGYGKTSEERKGAVGRRRRDLYSSRRAARRGVMKRTRIDYAVEVVDNGGL